MYCMVLQFYAKFNLIIQLVTNHKIKIRKLSGNLLPRNANLHDTSSYPEANYGIALWVNNLNNPLLYE